MERKDLILDKIKKKKGLFIFLVLLLVTSLAYLIIGGAFSYVETIAYPGGCTETYEDGILIKGNCSLEKSIFDNIEPYGSGETVYGEDIFNLSVYNES